MKTEWKSLILAGAVLSVACSVVMAGPAGGPRAGRGQARVDRQGMGFGPRALVQMGPTAEEGFERLARLLDLKDEQLDEIHDVFSQARQDAQKVEGAVVEARKTLHDAVTGGAGEEQIRTAAAALGVAIGNQAVLRAKTLASAKAVLTDEQREELEEMQDNQPRLRQRMRDSAGGAQGMARRRQNRADEPAERPVGGAKRGGAGPVDRGPLPLEQMFKTADADRDGTLTMDELRAFQRGRGTGRPRRQL